MEKNANNKVNTWSLELKTYNIMFELISGAHNKEADCLSWLVDVKDTPLTSTASINILVTSTPDGPATCTCSKRHNLMDTTPPTDAQPTSDTDKVNVPPPLMEKYKNTLWQMQKTDPFCKYILKWLLNGKAPSHDYHFCTH